jgi:hypothetical protein
MFIMSADIKGAGLDIHVVSCFDPTVVIARLRKRFPNVLIGPDDLSRKDIELLSQMKPMQGKEDALLIAQRDAQRRGPIWAFELPQDSDIKILGTAERHRVSFRSDRPIREPLRSEIWAWLRELKYGPDVTIQMTDDGDDDDEPPVSRSD